MEKAYTAGEEQLRKQLASVSVLNSDGERVSLTPEYVAAHMYIAVVNTAENASALERCPHEAVANLSAVVKSDLGDDRYLLVTNDFVPLFQKTPEEIMEQARINSAREGFTCRDMNQVIQETLLSDPAMRDFMPEMQIPAADDCPLYVITTPRGIDGASVIASRDFLREVHDRLGEDFYILPSSRHEVLAIPVSKIPTDTEELAAMVASVNATEVEPRDRLSNDVYYFDGRSLKLADSLTAERDNVFTATVQEAAAEHHRSH